MNKTHAREYLEPFQTRSSTKEFLLSKTEPKAEKAPPLPFKGSEALLTTFPDLMVGKNLIESRLRQDFGVIIVAIKKMSGEMIFNPVPSEVLEAGDVIVVIGKKENLRRMSEVL